MQWEDVQGDIGRFVGGEQRMSDEGLAIMSSVANIHASRVTIVVCRLPFWAVVYRRAGWPSSFGVKVGNANPALAVRQPVSRYYRKCRCGRDLGPGHGVLPAIENMIYGNLIQVVGAGMGRNIQTSFPSEEQNPGWGMF